MFLYPSTFSYSLSSRTYELSALYVIGIFARDLNTILSKNIFHAMPWLWNLYLSKFLRRYSLTTALRQLTTFLTYKEVTIRATTAPQVWYYVNQHWVLHCLSAWYFTCSLKLSCLCSAQKEMLSACFQISHNALAGVKKDTSAFHGCVCPIPHVV